MKKTHLDIILLFSSTHVHECTHAHAHTHTHTHVQDPSQRSIADEWQIKSVLQSPMCNPKKTARIYDSLMLVKTDDSRVGVLTASIMRMKRSVHNRYDRRAYWNIIDQAYCALE